ncbi:MAG: TolC family protein, partial [Massilibacteroides sp.]|nr:TolC family protein [Massilibacteroides sp.]
RQEENIRIAEGNYRIVLLEYQQQTTSLSDLLRAQNSLTEACLSYDNALLQLKNAALDLIKAKGELLTKTN